MNSQTLIQKLLENGKICYLPIINILYGAKKLKVKKK